MTSKKQYKILIVDDEDDLRTVLRIRLKAQGMEVIEASDGLEALEVAVREKPDLVVLDLMMPSMNGYETWREFKKRLSLRKIPIIILTCKRQSDDIFWGASMSHKNFFTKPYETEELMGRIKELLKLNEHQ